MADYVKASGARFICRLSQYKKIILQGKYHINSSTKHTRMEPRFASV